MKRTIVRAAAAATLAAALGAGLGAPAQAGFLGGGYLKKVPAPTCEIKVWDATAYAFVTKSVPCTSN